MIEDIRRRLGAYTPRRLAEDGRRRAGVLLPLYYDRDDWHVVLTKRTDRVVSHKGEVSFPGGGWEQGDADLLATALRESEEEIGLRRGDVRIIGGLDELITISDFHVSAFVGEIDPARSPYGWRPQRHEVAAVLEVPIRHLTDAANLIELPRQRNGELVVMEGVRFGEHIIFGATWRMLRNFLDVVVGGFPEDDQRVLGRLQR